MINTLLTSDPNVRLFFGKLVREMKESTQSIEATIKCAVDEGYFGADEHESILWNINNVRANADEAFLLHRVRDNSLLPPELRFPIAEAEALMTRVNRFTSEQDTAGLLRFVGFNNCKNGTPTSDEREAVGLTASEHFHVGGGQ